MTTCRVPRQKDFLDGDGGSDRATASRADSVVEVESVRRVQAAY